MAVKRAVPRLVRDSSGRMATIYVDLDTYQEVTDLTGYQVINVNSKIEEVDSIDNPDAPKSPDAQARQDLLDQELERERGSSSPAPPGQPGTTTGNMLSGMDRVAKGEFPSAPKSQTQQALARAETQRESQTSQPASNNTTSQSFTGASVSNPNRDNPGISYNHEDTRGAWDTGLTQDTKDVASRLSGAIGGMQPGRNPMTSAYRSEAVNAAVGGAKNSAHKHGAAFDMSTKGMTDEEKAHAVEMGRLSGAARIGTYADESLHFDMRPGFKNENMPGSIVSPDGVYGMYDETAENAAKNAPGWFSKGMTQNTVPTPTARPAPETAVNLMGPVKDEWQGFTPAPATAPMAGVTANPLSDTAMNSFAATPTSVAQGIMSQVGSPADVKSETKTRDSQQMTSVADMSPAEMASRGFFGTRSPDELSDMTRAVVGEMTPAQMEAAIAGNPEALAELASIQSSMENRAYSAKYGDLKNALDPSQYNSLMTENMDVTNANYSKYGPQMESLMAGFYTGQLAAPNFGVTSYYNSALVSPSWGAVMANPATVGSHTFGVLDGKFDYGVSKAFADHRAAVAAAQVSDTRGFTPTQDYAGSGFMGNFDSPRESNAAGLGSGSAGLGGFSGGSSAYGGSSGRSSDGSSTGGRGRGGFGASSVGGGGSRGDSGFGGGGIGSDHGGTSSGRGGSGSESQGGRGRGGYGASSAGSSSSSSSSSSSGGFGGGGIGSDHGGTSSGRGSSDKGDKGSSGQGGIGHA